MGLFGCSLLKLCDEKCCLPPRSLNELQHSRTPGTHRLSPHTCILWVGLRSVEPHLFASSGHIWTRQCKGHLASIWPDSREIFAAFTTWTCRDPALDNRQVRNNWLLVNIWRWCSHTTDLEGSTMNMFFEQFSFLLCSLSSELSCLYRYCCCCWSHPNGMSIKPVMQSWWQFLIRRRTWLLLMQYGCSCYTREKELKDLATLISNNWWIFCSKYWTRIKLVYSICTYTYKYWERGFTLQTISIYFI